MHNFERLSYGLDVSPLREALSINKALWDEVTLRQTYEGSAHKDTKSILLRWSRGLTAHDYFNEIGVHCHDMPAMGELPEARALINLTLETVGATQLGRVIIPRLRPGGKILPHSDEGAYADHYERFHVVIDSEEGNVFRCGGEEVYMKPGELWWFNHKVIHEVENLSDEPRTHMIIDCVAPSFRRERVAHAV